MSKATDSGLIRGIRRWDLVALVINSVVGAGIFGLPSKVYALTGTYSLFAFLAAAFVVIAIVLCFAEVSSRFTATGGPYLYARTVFGSAIGFEVGWLVWLARLISFATICNLLVLYLGYFWPEVSSGFWRTVVIVAMVTSLTIINLVGVRQSAIATDIFTIGKLVPLFLLIAAGMFFVDPHRYSLSLVPDYASFSTAVLLLIYAFTGFEVSLIAAGEITDPRRNLPFALLTGLGTTALLYVSIQFVCIGTLPGLASSDRPLAEAGSRILGPAGAWIISLGALISMTGTLNATMLAGSRLPFAMAEQGQVPRILGASHRRFQTPYISILLSSTLILALTLSGTFMYTLRIGTMIRLLTYATTCLALPLLRFKRDSPPASFKAPAGIVVSAISLALIAWLLSTSAWTEARDVGIAAVVGLLIYMAYRASVSRSRVSESSLERPE